MGVLLPFDGVGVSVAIRLSRGWDPGPAWCQQWQAHSLGSTPRLHTWVLSSQPCVPGSSAQPGPASSRRAAALLCSLPAQRSFCSCFPLTDPGSPDSSSAFFLIPKHGAPWGTLVSVANVYSCCICLDKEGAGRAVKCQMSALWIRQFCSQLEVMGEEPVPHPVHAWKHSFIIYGLPMLQRWWEFILIQNLRFDTRRDVS